MAVTYTLVNPQILGSFETTVKADNSKKAGRQFYNALSEHFNNTIPRFFFTIQKGGSGKGKYYHFKVIEEKDGDEVSYTLESVNNVKDSKIKSFEKKRDAFQRKCDQAGGGKKDSEDDDDFVSEDGTTRTFYSLFPTIWDYSIGYFWYDPYVYDLTTYYVPTFYSYITPLIEIVGF